MSEIRKTVGFVKCPITGDKAEVRRDKKQKLYYVGQAGMIKPNSIDGQKWLNENTEFLADEQAEAVNAAPVKYGQRVTTREFLESLESQKPKPLNQPHKNEDGGLLL
ncbi:MAG: hypothetical protein IBX55_18650 [Methyloprofundus sp.]|nr:hypothetical protein [Methyloprofundus sp.]